MDHAYLRPPVLLPRVCPTFFLSFFFFLPHSTPRNGFPQIQRTIRELVALLSTAAREGRTLDIDRLLMRDTLDVLGRWGRVGGAVGVGLAWIPRRPVISHPTLTCSPTCPPLRRVGFGVDFKAVAGFEAAAAMGKAAVPEQVRAACTL